MNNDIETVMSALLAHLKMKAAGFKSYSRRAEMWSKVADQPALFVREIGLDDSYANNIFAVTVLDVEIWIYSRAGEDPKTAPSIALNDLVKRVRDSFAPDDFQRGVFTLGGKANWCRVEGRTDMDSGDLDAQSKALMRVKIMLP